MRYFAYVSLSLFLLASTENASASCLVFNQNERLSNYCLLETLKGKIVDQYTVNILTDTKQIILAIILMTFASQASAFRCWGTDPTLSQVRYSYRLGLLL